MSKDIYGEFYGQVFKGYFLAPVTGNYIFRGAGDDQYSMHISSDYGTIGSPLSPEISGSWAQASGDNYYISNVSTSLGNPHYL